MRYSFNFFALPVGWNYENIKLATIIVIGYEE